MYGYPANYMQPMPMHQVPWSHNNMYPVENVDHSQQGQGPLSHLPAQISGQ